MTVDSFVRFELSYNQSDMTITGSFAVGFNQRSTDCIPFLALAAFLLNSKTVKMGLKSNEIDHLPIRQLKQTANEPVTKFVLLMTETYAQIDSIISMFDCEAQLSSVTCQLSTKNVSHFLCPFAIFTILIITL